MSRSDSWSESVMRPHPHSLGRVLMAKRGGLFQYPLASFILLTFSIIILFLGFVLRSMFYVIISKQVSMYMGTLKRSAETYAFLFSTFSLILIGFPSIHLLYKFSCQVDPALIIKITASQWYWRYEVSSMVEEAIPVYMSPLNDLMVGSKRLLEVENRLILPTGVLVQFNITSRDVIHSFALPTLGVKVDATPGLLTVAPIIASKVGTHYGQCSEICGMNHAFIPFSVEVVSFPIFIWWLLSL